MIFIVVKFPIRPDKLDEWEGVRAAAHPRVPAKRRAACSSASTHSVDDPNE